jgi:hypothetical protein
LDDNDSACAAQAGDSVCSKATATELEHRPERSHASFVDDGIARFAGRGAERTVAAWMEACAETESDNCRCALRASMRKRPIGPRTQQM